MSILEGGLLGHNHISGSCLLFISLNHGQVCHHLVEGFHSKMRVFLRVYSTLFPFILQNFQIISFPIVIVGKMNFSKGGDMQHAGVTFGVIAIF
jgi:hypothetical protein